MQAELDAELVGVGQSVTSAISTWMTTIGGRRSSSSTIARISSKYRGVALMIRLLVTSLGHDDDFALDLLERADQADCWRTAAAPAAGWSETG